LNIFLILLFCVKINNLLPYFIVESAMMEAIIKHKEERGGLVLGQVEEQPCGPRDVIIKLQYAAICGTDYHIFSWDSWAQNRIKTPLVIGHEFAGTVVEIGKDVRAVKVGDRVSAECHITCGSCFFCRTGQKHICNNAEIFGVDRSGVFAEKFMVPEENVWIVDPDIPFEFASLFDPIGNAMHTVMSAPMAGQNVLIQGCGPIGLFAVSIAKHCGAKVWASDINPTRLKLAEEMGATRLIDVTQENLIDLIKSETYGRGVDVVLEMSGNGKALQDSLQCVRNGGDVKLLGIPSNEVTVDFAEWVIFRGVKIEGIIGRRLFETWYQIEHFLKNKLLDPSPVITHRLDFRDFQKGFDAITEGNAAKVILSF